jgi:hypothetical protein
MLKLGKTQKLKVAGQLRGVAGSRGESRGSRGESRGVAGQSRGSRGAVAGQSRGVAGVAGTSSENNKYKLCRNEHLRVQNMWNQSKHARISSCEPQNHVLSART